MPTLCHYRRKYEMTGVKARRKDNQCDPLLRNRSRGDRTTELHRNAKFKEPQNVPTTTINRDSSIQWCQLSTPTCYGLTPCKFLIILRTTAIIYIV